MLAKMRTESSNKLELERVEAVKLRAATFCDGYRSAVAIFNKNCGYVKHRKGVTEIVAHTCMVDLSRLNVFCRRGDDYRHLYLPITITGFGNWNSQIKINVFWENKS